MAFDDTTLRGAVFDKHRQYRYRLWRILRLRPDLPRLVVCMLNPSMASDTKDDPTMLAVMSFANAWGYGRVDVVNLFAWIATDPDDLASAHNENKDVVGPDNDRHITEAVINSDAVLCAWGSHALAPARAREIWPTLALGRGERIALKVSKETGMPYHPLYVARSVRPAPFVLAEAA